MADVDDARLVLSRRQVREIDRRALAQYGMLGLVLMENAGRGAADILAEEAIQGTVVICCGKGNNGGDGFVIARQLESRGIATQTLIFCDPAEYQGDAAVNLCILQKSGLPWERLDLPTDEERLAAILRGADWLVDALLGTGATGEPRGAIRTVIERMNESGRPILAVDLPSGLDCDTGEPASVTIGATQTCTFVAMKPGFLNPSAAAYLGKVAVVNIGVPGKLIEEVASSTGN